MERDFRFEITPLDEPELGCTHLVRQIETIIRPPDERWPITTIVDGEEIDCFTTDNPYGAVEAAREAQVFSLEERLETYAARGW